MQKADGVAFLHFNLYRSLAEAVLLAAAMSLAAAVSATPITLPNGMPTPFCRSVQYKNELRQNSVTKRGQHAVQRRNGVADMADATSGPMPRVVR